MRTGVKLFLCALAIAIAGASALSTESQQMCDWSVIHLKVVFEVLKRGLSAPPAVARELAIRATCVWDAVAPYTDSWEPVYAQEISRRPPAERTDANRLKAASIASYQALVFLYNKTCPDCLSEARSKVFALGLNPEYQGTDLTIPSGVAHIACSQVTQARRFDGSNQFGDEFGSNVNAKVYSDFTGYVPSNPANPPPAINFDPVTDCSALNSLNKWAPIRLRNAANQLVTQSYSLPHWGAVKPFAMSSGSQFRPPPPPFFNTANNNSFVEYAEELLKISGQLDDRKKAITEYWADGPATTSPPGHWHQIAIDLALSRDLSLLDTISLVFLQSNAVMDAGIAAWDAKRYYDNSRPLTVLQCLFRGQVRPAWKGPYQGVGDMDIAEWKPFQFKTFVTPPFSEYVSGHSTFSGASAEVLRRFFGSDVYGATYNFREGTSFYEPKITDTNNTKYRPGLTDVPNSGYNTQGYSPAKDVILSWPTFTAAAEEAGMSRLYGGIHFHPGNVFGLGMGRQVAEAVHDKWLHLSGRVVDSGKSISEDACLSKSQQLNYSVAGGVIGVAAASTFLLILALVIHWCCLRASKPSHKSDQAQGKHVPMPVIVTSASKEHMASSRADLLAQGHANTSSQYPLTPVSASSAAPVDSPSHAVDNRRESMLISGDLA